MDSFTRRTFIASVATTALGALALALLPSGFRPPAAEKGPVPPAPGDPFVEPDPSSRLVDRLTVHHTASGSRASDGGVIDIGVVAGWHRKRGLNMGFGDHRGAAYHYLILPDGTIQAGRPLALRSSGTRSMDDNRTCIAVCLVGDFQSSSNPIVGGRSKRWPAVPTRSQMKSLKRVALWAMDAYGFGAERVHGHREISSSSCPGDRFEIDEVRRSLRTLRRAGDTGTPPPGARVGVLPAGTRAAGSGPVAG